VLAGIAIVIGEAGSSALGSDVLGVAAPHAASASVDAIARA
jgi:hypothetical protein